MKYLLVYLAVGVYYALSFYKKGMLKLKKPFAPKNITAFLSENLIVMTLWPLSILLRVAMRKPDSLQLNCFDVDEKTRKTHLTFSLNKGNTILNIKDEQMQEIITMWCLSKIQKEKVKTLTIHHQDKILDITILDQ